MPWRGFALALRFLTRLPLPAGPAPIDPATAAPAAAAWFPLAGAVVGVVTAAVYALAARWFGPLASSTLAVLAGVLVTGAFHLDGLADTADGLACGGGRDKRLAVMRDPRVGTMGALAAGASLLLKVAFLSEMEPDAAAFTLVLAPVMGRWGMVLAMPRHPYAREEPGLGRAFAEGTGPRQVLAATAQVVLVLAAQVALAGPAPTAVMRAAAAAGLAAGAARLVAVFLARRLGGLTGDTYGAINEVVEVAILGWAAAR